MLAWTVRSWRIVGSGGEGLWNQWHDPRYLKPPGFARANYDSANKINTLSFMDGN
ncbi:hypothetical protein SS05631_a41770 (plasmid) [Sinorhizobium sp. CCBAU 05631]|nr:hypothetical protein SS05631_a41770 [Sinorhizobium sp. CCBAU 05631]